MKDITITAKRQKKELFVFFICFLFSFLLNFLSIIIYDTEWKELFTHIGYVTVISVFLYGLSALVRCAIGFVSCIFRKKAEK